MFMSWLKGYWPGSSNSQSIDIFGHNCTDGSTVVTSQCSELKQRKHKTPWRNWEKLQEHSILRSNISKHQMRSLQLQCNNTALRQH